MRARSVSASRARPPLPRTDVVARPATGRPKHRPDDDHDDDERTDGCSDCGLPQQRSARMMLHSTQGCQNKYSTILETTAKGSEERKRKVERASGERVAGICILHVCWRLPVSQLPGTQLNKQTLRGTEKNVLFLLKTLSALFANCCQSF